MKFWMVGKGMRSIRK